MDTQKDVVMALSQVTEELAKSNFIVGVKQLKKALKNFLQGFLYINISMEIRPGLCYNCFRINFFAKGAAIL